MTAPPPRLHALLIGIDGYKADPLNGCANDVELVGSLLARVPGSTVQRLVSPHPDRVRASRGERPATLAHIRAALDELRSDAIRPCDRVFLFYSGHSARIEFTDADGQLYHREAWLPVDYDDTLPRRVLFDFELNAFLAALAARTRLVTVAIDSCFGAGVTRGPDDPDLVARFRNVDGGDCLPPGTDRPGGMAVGVDACHVVTASLNHEAAREGGSGDERAGVFTRALVEALRAIPDEQLPTVPWAWIWPSICAEVTRRNARQHPWMSGSAARAVIAGPPVNADAGFAIARPAPRIYELRAGSLAGVTRGARIAVYASEPARFPPLGSAADREAHGGRLLAVDDATLSTAIAVPTGTPFELPPGARARLVAAGAAARVGCCVVPRDAELEAELAASPLLEVVEPACALARVERRGGTWAVMDDVHGAGEVTHPLATFTARADARPILEHFTRYSLPLRIVAQCTDLDNSLQLDVLVAPDHRLAPHLAQETALPEVPRTRGLYVVRRGARLCFRVRNTGSVRLRVTLLDCAGSGRVQRLGDQSIDAGASYRFWTALGTGFAMTISDGRPAMLDRLVAVGRTAMADDLAYLTVDDGFAGAVAATRSHARGGELPPELWSAASAMVLIAT